MKIARSDGGGSKGKCACVCERWIGVGEREVYKEEMGVEMEWHVFQKRLHVLRSLSCRGCM